MYATQSQNQHSLTCILLKQKFWEVEYIHMPILQDDIINLCHLSEPRKIWLGGMHYPAHKFWCLFLFIYFHIFPVPITN